MKMLEQVARALCRACAKRADYARFKDGLLLDKHVDDSWTLWSDDARVAVLAMREPTGAMVDAVPYDMYEPDVAANWRTMIDVVLSEVA